MSKLKNKKSEKEEASRYENTYKNNKSDTIITGKKSDIKSPYKSNIKNTSDEDEVKTKKYINIASKSPSRLSDLKNEKIKSAASKIINKKNDSDDDDNVSDVLTRLKNKKNLSPGN